MTSLSVLAISQRIDGQVAGDSDTAITGAASLKNAKTGDVAFFVSASSVTYLKTTKASAVIVTEAFVKACPCVAIVVRDPMLAFADVAGLFSQNAKAFSTGVHDSVVIGKNVQLGSGIAIGPNTVLGDNTCLDDNVCIGSNVTLAENVSIGKGSTIASHVVITRDISVGQNTVIDSGVVLGTEPYNPIKAKGTWHPGPVLGSVIIEDNVHIGANTCVSRGALSDTYIEKGVIIDNLVQIGHDVIVGKHSTIAACAAIGAYTTIKPHCIIGGGSCIAGRLTIDSDVTVTGMAAVTRSLHKAGIYSSGTTAQKHELWRKNVARFHHLESLVKRIKILEHKLDGALMKKELNDE